VMLCASRTATSIDESRPIFTREGALACPSLNNAQLAASSRDHGWRYQSTLFGVPNLPGFCVSKPVRQPLQLPWKKAAPECTIFPGQDVSPQTFGCTVLHDGVPVAIDRTQEQKPGWVASDVGWLSTLELRNGPDPVALEAERQREERRQETLKTLSTMTGRSIRVFAQGHSRTGDTLAPAQMSQIFFMTEPCSLNIAGAENMRRAWFALGAYQIGCWYPTQNGMYVVIYGTGQIYPQEAYWEAMPRALLRPDGTATITEPNYESVTFERSVINKKSMEQLQSLQDHLHEKP